MSKMSARHSTVLFAMLLCVSASAQLKPRPDAFPPVDETTPKAVQMATSRAEMAMWDRYPTYETYLSMMQHWVDSFPTLCHVDTIGTSVQGRLILSIYIQPHTYDDLYRPEFFYSSTIHGDEVTGYVMMLRLIDTLLCGYGNNPQYTDLINRTRISINPLANPDGTYYRGNNTVQGSRRYNANNVDLNRNYPDPFHPAKETLQPENEQMIAYVSAHNFLLSANLHGGSEVMNYPWDSFTLAEQPHPYADWWQDVCRRFVDTSRTYNSNHFRDVTASGYIAGGDWYVISGGRQDYMNYYHNCLEMTMELSSQKTLSSNRLPDYWMFLQHPLVNYIAEIHSLPGSTAIDPVTARTVAVSPNPASDIVSIAGLPADSEATLIDATGRRLMQLPTGNGTAVINMAGLPHGVYALCVPGAVAVKFVKQ